MVTKVITHKLNLTNALDFLSNTISGNNTVYVTACRPSPAANDSTVTEINRSDYYANFGIFNEFVFGKRLESDDAVVMIKRNSWSNIVFDYYDHRNEDLSNSAFYTAVSTNTGVEVFKCIWNNNGAVSEVAPSAASTDESEVYYETADGYKWKYLYSVDDTTLNKFSHVGDTGTFIPCIPNANVATNAANGAVVHFVIDDPGARYNSYHSGFFSQGAVGGNTLIHAIDSTASANTDFYKNCAIKIVSGTGAGQQAVVTEYIVSGTQRRVLVDDEFNPVPDLTSEYEITPRVAIEGDGEGLIARAIVNTSTNTIHSIEITNYGQNYSWVEAQVVGNTGIISNNTAIIANTASVSAIISPYGGHGANVYSELFAQHVGISATFANNESGTIPTVNDYRTWAVVRNPKFADVKLTLTNVSGTFIGNEEIVQANTFATANVTSVATGEIRVHNATGRFETGNTIHNVIRGSSSNATATVSTIDISGINKDFATFDQRMRMDITPLNIFEFQEDEFVTQSETDAIGYIHEANTSFLALTATQGTWSSSDISITYEVSGNTSDALADVGTIIQPDLHKFIGEVLYIENVLPISRGDEQSETLRLVLKF